MGLCNLLYVSEFWTKVSRQKITNGFETNSKFASISNRDAGRGWQRMAIALPAYDGSVNPIPSKGQIMPTTLLLASPLPQIFELYVASE